MIRALGENPEKLLSREALIAGATTEKATLTVLDQAKFLGKDWAETD